MGGKRPLLDAPGLGAFALTLLVATLFPGSPAGATDPVCEQVWDRLAHWSEQEAEKGLTTARLDALQELIPLFSECSEAGLVEHEGMGSDAGRWRDLVEVYFDGDDVDRVICLMEKESGGNPNARNRSSGASGLMQVMPGWADVFGYSPDDLFDPTVNLWIASRIRHDQGWNAWTPYQRGSCR
ncbi:MAG TPA: lytic transglycosylase domain-containing protein [Acidimicrobiia bacterium]|nr:lytic transglycosylase domain-containing protein [Acidimicrobiia bacterium]